MDPYNERRKPTVTGRVPTSPEIQDLPGRPKQRCVVIIGDDEAIRQQMMDICGMSSDEMEEYFELHPYPHPFPDDDLQAILIPVDSKKIKPIKGKQSKYQRQPWQ